MQMHSPLLSRSTSCNEKNHPHEHYLVDESIENKTWHLDDITPAGTHSPEMNDSCHRDVCQDDKRGCSGSCLVWSQCITELNQKHEVKTIPLRPLKLSLLVTEVIRRLWNKTQLWVKHGWVGHSDVRGKICHFLFCCWYFVKFVCSRTLFSVLATRGLLEKC